MAEPRELIERIERDARVPDAPGERFSGYGVMGLPFASGHILGLRRFPASSIGPGYTSIWHRDPAGRWTFFQTVPPEQACTRFFGRDVAEAPVREISIEWTGPRSLRITVPDEVDWQLTLASSAVTRLMNGMGALMPDALWRSGAVLRVMSALASVALGAGRLGMVGTSSNGQRFIANPLRIWLIPDSRAVVRGVDLGPVGPAPEQAHLGDFWIPQRGILAIGRAFFETFDPARHAAATG
jgi:hypothetical protein